MQQTLLDIRRKTDITIKSIAERANLPIADVFVVEAGGFTSRETAQKVVTAFNQLSGMSIQLEDIKLNSIESGESQSAWVILQSYPERTGAPILSKITRTQQR